MPPRRSSQLAARAPMFEQLPDALFVEECIFGRVPVDTRLRCREVCRAWRAGLTAPACRLWTRLELTWDAGVDPGLVTDSLLLAAAAAAGEGNLTALDVKARRLTPETLLRVVTANAGALRELRVRGDIELPRLRALLAAAPALTALYADLSIRVDAPELLALLRGEEPTLALLRLCGLSVTVPNVIMSPSALGGGDLTDFAEALAARPQAWLEELSLSDQNLNMTDWVGDYVISVTPEVLETLVDAACACPRLRELSLSCAMTADLVPPLARLVADSDTLEELSLEGRMEHAAADLAEEEVLVDEESSAALCAALRANNTTLTGLTLRHVNLWRNAHAAAALLLALTGRAGFWHLDLWGNALLPLHDADEDVDLRADADIIGAALGAYVAAGNKPVSGGTSLALTQCRLGDAALRPLAAALPSSTHLRMLFLDGNAMSAAFERDVLMPAAIASASLCGLSCEDGTAWVRGGEEDEPLCAGRAFRLLKRGKNGGAGSGADGGGGDGGAGSVAADVPLAVGDEEAA